MRLSVVIRVSNIAQQERANSVESMIASRKRLKRLEELHMKHRGAIVADDYGTDADEVRGLLRAEREHDELLETQGIPGFGRM